MRASFLISVAAGLLLAGCDNNQSSTSQSSNTSGTTSNYTAGKLATAPVDYIGTVAKAGINAGKLIDVSYLNEAVQQFNVQEGRYPKNLDELVPNYVGKLPPVAYGFKLDYDPNTGQVKVVKE